MLYVILGIVIGVAIIEIIGGIKDANNSNISDEKTEIDWWTVGMIADLHNKSREKKK